MVEILEKKITAQEFLLRDDFEELFQYELIDGKIIKRRGQSWQHQNASVNLIGILGHFVKDKMLGKIYAGPLDVYFSEIDLYQPDLLFLSNQQKGLIKSEGIFGAPELVIEILSPESHRNDRNRKMKIYKRSGILEYWIVAPDQESIEVYNLLDGNFDMTYFAFKTGTVQSQVLAGLAVNLEEVFA